MASSTSLSAPIQVTSAAENSFPRNLTLDLDAVVHSVGKAKTSKCDARGNVLTKRAHLHRQEHVLHFHSQRSHGKRRTSSSTHDHRLAFKRRRRLNSMVLPTKFLLGGNITDPLNLRSLEDEEVNQRLNAFTPETSPIPLPRHKAQVQVLIPPNIYDPLNLNSGEEIEFNIVSPKLRKRKRHRKNKKEQPSKETSLDHVELVNISNESEEVPVLTTEESCDKEKYPLTSPPVSDKIVSPVVPQGSPSKFYKRFHSKLLSKDDSEKLLPTTGIFPKRRRSKSKVLQNNSNITFRKADEKFSLGNFVRNYSYGDEDTDPRLKYLSKDFFENKEVLDVGCNTGHLTLSIAEYFEPKAILGIDIDERLIRIAQKNTCRHLSASVCKGKRFPISMALSYGPLVKLPMPVRKEDMEKFPNNVSFLQADYVPPDDEPIDDQPVDTILCLRVTQWVHLNYSDDGIKRMFKRIYQQLRTGGQLILEPQPWSSYSKKKKMTPLTYANYQNIKLKPDKFCEYLLSDEVGFSTCELIGHPFHTSKGHKSALYLLRKGIPSTSEEHIEMSHHMSSFGYDGMWISSDEEYHGQDRDHSHVMEVVDRHFSAPESLSPHETDISDNYISERSRYEDEKDCGNVLPACEDIQAVTVSSTVDEHSHENDSNRDLNNISVSESTPEEDSMCNSVKSDCEYEVAYNEMLHCPSKQHTSSKVCAADSTCN